MTRLALVQLGGEPGAADANRTRSVAAAREAMERGAEIVVLPELIVPGYDWEPERVAAGAEPLDGETVSAWSTIAREGGAHVAGGFAEHDGDAIYNAAVLVGPEGVVLHYRKLHLFGGERAVFAPGDRGLPVADTRHGTLGLCVCYDLRFVETLRILSLRGAALVCVPTAWVAGFDAERWDAAGFAPQARGAVLQANLDQVFVACASQAGVHGDFEFLGSSIVADPRGRCLAGPLAGDADAIVTVDLDLADAEAARDRGGDIRPRADRRADVYSLEVDGVRL